MQTRARTELRTVCAGRDRGDFPAGQVNTMRYNDDVSLVVVRSIFANIDRADQRGECNARCPYANVTPFGMMITTSALLRRTVKRSMGGMMRVIIAHRSPSMGL